VDWGVFQMKPPMNQEEWEAEFAKYKQFPEYQKYVLCGGGGGGGGGGCGGGGGAVLPSHTYHLNRCRLNPNMDVEGFKRIYLFEWAHRNLGRLLGAMYALPLLYFTARGYLRPPMRIRLYAIAAGIGFQVLLLFLSSVPQRCCVLPWLVVVVVVSNNNNNKNNSSCSVSRISPHLLSLPR